MKQHRSESRAFGLLIASASWLAVACGPDAGNATDSKPTPSSTHDASPDSLVVPATNDAAHDSAPAIEAGTTESDARQGDAGPRAYVRTDGGPFGIAARAAKQTCLAPAKYDQPVASLLATGCVDPKDPTKPAPSLIPFEVNSPLWSDGADKQRFLALPDGALVHVKDCTAEPATCKPKAEGGTTEDEGHWQLPVGTVLVKSFLFANKFIETRLFVRFSDMWAGYSYQWNDGQTDATLVAEDGLTKNIVNGSAKMQSWYFPKRNDCLECHNDAVGSSIGLETIQLDRTASYAGNVTANQIATLEHLGVFDAPVPRLTALVDPRLPDNTGKNLDIRARSYLHANCATCHRPEGNYSAIDMRYGVPLAKMNACNVDPNKGDLGVAGSKRLFAGTPSKSVMLLRMQALDTKSGRMPQLATSVLDPNGISIVSDWIKSITTCL